MYLYIVHKRSEMEKTMAKNIRRFVQHSEKKNEKCNVTQTTKCEAFAHFRTNKQTNTHSYKI